MLQPMTHVDSEQLSCCECNQMGLSLSQANVGLRLINQVLLGCGTGVKADYASMVDSCDA